MSNSVICPWSTVLATARVSFWLEVTLITYPETVTLEINSNYGSLFESNIWNPFSPFVTKICPELTEWS